MSKKRLILIELNEINFDFVREYLKKHELVNLKRMLAEGVQETSSENKYEELEPWIQWVSAHTGKSLEEHNVFRLGDIVNSDVEQIFEKVESKGYSVGCISPMNAKNNLKAPSYFIPDPWTLTPSDKSFWSRKLTQVVQQVVNDNAKSKVSMSSFLFLFAGLIRFSRIKNYSKYISLALSSFKKPWSKAMFLDLLLHDIHWSMLQKKRPEFSTLFINAGAHIQHHYMFNSKVYTAESKIKNPAWYIDDSDDPMLELLKLYDVIISDYLNCDYDVLIATGLTQIPFTHEKYYWRIKEHAKFLKSLGIKYLTVAPRMTRDFLVTFENSNDAILAESKLKKIKSISDDVFLFNEIDNRGDSLFVTLSYPNEVKGEFKIINGEQVLDISNELAFVAVKNGMHSPKGFFFAKGNIDTNKLNNKAHVKNIYNVISDYFSA